MVGSKTGRHRIQIALATNEAQINSASRRPVLISIANIRIFRLTNPRISRNGLPEPVRLARGRSVVLAVRDGAVR